MSLAWPLAVLAALLPLAAWSGWVIGRRQPPRPVRTSGADSELSTSYFRGLNYLLNEEQDKAIEVFLKLAEAERHTIDTHLTLGSLFRRRGEVDRAIRVHQHLIAQPGLSAEQKTVALLELGEDYMRAGLLDRAETLFGDLVAMDAMAAPALRHLVRIYQHERDWTKAISYARRLEEASGESQADRIAHFHCELADKAYSGGHRDEAREHLAKARAADPACIRAGLLTARIEASDGNHDEAIVCFERALRSDVGYIAEVLDPLLECYARTGKLDRARQFLASVAEQYRGVAPLLALARLREESDGEPAARAFLNEALPQRASIDALVALIDANSEEAPAEARQLLEDLRGVAMAMGAQLMRYRCNRCGFRAKVHHWQCPSCKSWASVRRAHGLLGA